MGTGRLNPPSGEAAKQERMAAWEQLQRAIVQCDRCPRLRAHCRQVAREKRRAYREWLYWGRPVPDFGSPQARLLLVGLAPAAHGANRTGRMFTGDRSGQWLYRALYRAGFANQAHSESRHDGLELYDCTITAVCHCAPPQNRPTAQELANCRPWLEQTLHLVPFRVLVALGQVAWQAVVRHGRSHGWFSGSPPRFAHGAVVPLSQGRWLLGCYHPSQQNTFTGRLTEEMFDQVFTTARKLLEQRPTRNAPCHGQTVTELPDESS